MASAAVLAGGHGRRLGGRDKSAMVVHGRTMLDRQVAELLTVTDDILLVGPRRDCGDQRCRVVRDRIADSGPLGGLDAALAAARDDVVVVVACDMPFLNGAFLKYLAALAADADAVVPMTERGYHPLCAVYSRRCQPFVAARLANRQLALRGLLEDVRVRAVGRDELERFGNGERLLANVNTPGELDDLEALLSHEL